MRKYALGPQYTKYSHEELTTDCIHMYKKITRRDIYKLEIRITN